MNSDSVAVAVADALKATKLISITAQDGLRYGDQLIRQMLVADLQKQLRGVRAHRRRAGRPPARALSFEAAAAASAWPTPRLLRPRHARRAPRGRGVSRTGRSGGVQLGLGALARAPRRARVLGTASGAEAAERVLGLGAEAVIDLPQRGRGRPRARPHRRQGRRPGPRARAQREPAHRREARVSQGRAHRRHGPRPRADATAPSARHSAKTSPSCS